MTGVCELLLSPSRRLPAVKKDTNCRLRCADVSTIATECLAQTSAMRYLLEYSSRALQSAAPVGPGSRGYLISRPVGLSGGCRE